MAVPDSRFALCRQTEGSVLGHYQTEGLIDIGNAAGVALDAFQQIPQAQEENM
jgi:hypothetical protein